MLSWNTLISYSLLEWWVPLIKFMMWSIINVRGEGVFYNFFVNWLVKVGRIVIQRMFGFLVLGIVAMLLWVAVLIYNVTLCSVIVSDSVDFCCRCFEGTLSVLDKWWVVYVISFVVHQLNYCIDIWYYGIISYGLWSWYWFRILNIRTFEACFLLV